MKIAQEEIFGPVLSVIPFKGADEALRLANDTMYGLAAAVWTKDIDRAFKFAKGIKAETVWINSYHAAGTLGVPLMPFGGYKQSGIGRELGQEGMLLNPAQVVSDQRLNGGLGAAAPAED